MGTKYPMSQPNRIPTKSVIVWATNRAMMSCVTLARFSWDSIGLCTLPIRKVGPRRKPHKRSRREMRARSRGFCSKIFSTLAASSTSRPKGGSHSMEYERYCTDCYRTSPSTSNFCLHCGSHTTILTPRENLARGFRLGSFHLGRREVMLIIGAVVVALLIIANTVL